MAGLEFAWSSHQLYEIHSANGYKGQYIERRELDESLSSTRVTCSDPTVISILAHVALSSGLLTPRAGSHSHSILN
jgi:hypothetical protein